MTFENLFLPPYDIFTTVAMFTLGLSVLEILLILFGFSVSKFLHIDHDVSLNLDAKNAIDFSHFSHDPLEHVNLFNIGQVPFLAVILFFTSFFSSIGFGTHLLASNLGFTLSNMLVVPLTVGVSSFLTYKATKVWKKIFPNIESYAVSERSLVGKIGVVNLGTATDTNAVEIAVYDQHKAKHYVMASLAIKDVAVHQNEKVMLVHKHKNGRYLALPVVETEKEAHKQEQVTYKEVS